MTPPTIEGDPPPPAPMPRTLGRYEVRAKIGEGGMATVYVGRQRGAVGPDRVVALKVIREELTHNPDFTHMFIDEARLVAKLWHPSIVKIYELGEDAGRLFIAMELLLGQSLLEVFESCRARGKPIPSELAAWMGARVADGLHHAHELADEKGVPQQVIHRDVSPANVFVTFDGGVKVIDFGLAKAVNRVSKTAAGIVKGKLAYLSPEAAGGQAVDRRTDIFALGTTLWEISTGQRLFRQPDDVETLRRIHAARVPDPATIVPGYPPGLWAVVRRALARDREARFQTAADLARDLDAFLVSTHRAVGAMDVAAFMQELFPAERERQAAWLQDASGPRAAPMLTLKPSSSGIAPVVVLPADPAGLGAPLVRPPPGPKTIPMPVVPTPGLLSPTGNTARQIGPRPAPRRRSPKAAVIAVALVVLLAVGVTLSFVLR